MGLLHIQASSLILVIIIASISLTRSEIPGSNATCQLKYISGTGSMIRSLNQTMFEEDACALCYSYIPSDHFSPFKLVYHPWRPGCLSDISSNETTVHCLNNKDDGKMIGATFRRDMNRDGLTLWRNCCAAARDCCNMMLSRPTKSLEGLSCDGLWDGWKCFDETPADTTVKFSCPSYVYFYSNPPPDNCRNNGSNRCLASATWQFKTDYSTCGQTETIKKRLYANLAAFAVSIVFLIPAVCIFLSYKQLRVPRITMHTNLFISLILNGVVVIIYKSVLGLNALASGSSKGVIQENSGGCKFALALIKYTRMTTYMWMFCEGFYLHKLIVAAFAEEKRLIIYYILGWAFPVIPVTIYSLIRHIYADKECWMPPYGGFEWIINAPMLLSLALNLAFLCNIIRVLITKLKATRSNEPISQYRKAVRAIVVLVPLFGVHFLLTIYLPDGTCGVAIELYFYFNYVIDGLQGFVVSLIFCYFNGEVMHLLKRSYNRHRLMKDPRGRHLSCRTDASTTQNISITEMPSNNSFIMKNAIPLK